MVDGPREADLIGCRDLVDRSIIKIGLVGPLATIHEDLTEDEFESNKGKGRAATADAGHQSLIIWSQRPPLNDRPAERSSSNSSPAALAQGPLARNRRRNRQRREMRRVRRKVAKMELRI